MKNKGFTLLESLVVALLAAIIGMGSLSVIVNSNEILSKGAVKSMRNANMDRLVDELVKDIRRGAVLEMRWESSSSVLEIKDSDNNVLYSWRTNYLYNSTTYEQDTEIFRSYLDPTTGNMITSQFNVVDTSTKEFLIWPNFTIYPVGGSRKHYKADIWVYMVAKNKANTQSWTPEYKYFMQSAYCRMEPFNSYL